MTTTEEYIMTGSLEQRVNEMSGDMREMRNSMKVVAEAVTKLAVLDEKSHFHAENTEKLNDKVEKLEEKFRISELDRVKFEATTVGIARTKAMMWGAAGSGIVIVAELIRIALER
jgi:hypothetical protein